VVKTFTFVVKEKFEPLLVDHLGGGHSQSVLLAMEKLLKNSVTLKGACTHPRHSIEFAL
jgi:azurin